MKLAIAATAVAFGSLFATPQPETAPRAAAEATTWTVDGTHSGCMFRIQHANAGMFYGRFNTVEGEFVLDPDALDQSRVRIRVKADSVDTASEGRDKHLRSPDFLDAAQFAWINFESDKITKADDATYEVSGTLEMRGVKKPLTLTAEHTGTGEFRGSTRAGFETKFAIKRSDFGVNYGLKGNVLGDEVTLMFGLELIKQ